MPTSGWQFATAWGAVLLGLAGCAIDTDGMMAAAPVTGYTASTLLYEFGYSETKLSGNKYRIRVLATAVTPQSRVTDIAVARAGGIGVAGKFAYFTVTAQKQGMECLGTKNTQTNHRSVRSGAPFVEYDVEYSQEPAAGVPSYESVRALQEKSASLSQEVIAGDARVLNFQLARSECQQHLQSDAGMQ
jgi:hypothetical protein